MEIINIREQSSILNQYISEIRDKNIQKDSMRFRRNIERIGECFALEISKTLKYRKTPVETPLGIAECDCLDEPLVIASILRAALPLHEGFLNIFDRAQNAFIGAFRKYGKDNKFKIDVEYSSVPDMSGKTLILLDTMLATGSSIVLAQERICQDGEPSRTHIVCPIASKSGIEYVSRHLTHKKTTLWVGAIDEELTNKSYIIPGLGDAGDLAFGEKL